MTDNHASLIAVLQSCIDDPMWADHAEVSKRTLRKAVAALTSLPSQQEEAARDVHAAHWLAIRPKVIEALAAEGLEILSNADGGVWLNRRKASTASAEPEPIESVRQKESS